jgi:hypothetical protein
LSKVEASVRAKLESFQASWKSRARNALQVTAAAIAYFGASLPIRPQALRVRLKTAIGEQFA